MGQSHANSSRACLISISIGFWSTCSLGLGRTHFRSVDPVQGKMHHRAGVMVKKKLPEDGDKTLITFTLFGVF